MGASGAFSWNSELPSGHNPFWIRDESLADFNLHPGDLVSVDTSADPHDGDLVVVEADVDGDSYRLARRYFATADRVRLEPAGGEIEVIDLPAENVMVMGIIRGRVRLVDGGARVIEEPLQTIPDQDASAA
jgi:SOS-response transcriptional repressor LexA